MHNARLPRRHARRRLRRRRNATRYWVQTCARSAPAVTGVKCVVGHGVLVPPLINNQIELLLLYLTQLVIVSLDIVVNKHGAPGAALVNVDIRLIIRT